MKMKPYIVMIRTTSQSVKTIVSNFHTILKTDNNILSMQYMLGTILSAL